MMFHIIHNIFSNIIMEARQHKQQMQLMLRNTLPFQKKLLQFEKDRLIEQLSNNQIDEYKYEFTETICLQNDFRNLEMIQEIEADLNRSYKMQSEREKQKKNEDLSRQ